MTIVARVVFAGFFISAYVSAFVELVDHPSLTELGRGRSRLRDAGHGDRLGGRRLARASRPHPGVALAVVAVCALVITPAAEAQNPEGAWLAFAGLAVVLAIAAVRGSNNWVRGVRCGAVPVIGGIFRPCRSACLLDAIETLDTVLSGSQTAAWDTRLDASSVENYTVWIAPIVVAAFIAVVLFVTRWPELADFRVYATTAVAGAVALGAVDAVVTTRMPVWAIAAVLLVVEPPSWRCPGAWFRPVRGSGGGRRGGAASASPRRRREFRGDLDRRRASSPASPRQGPELLRQAYAGRRSYWGWPELRRRSTCRHRDAVTGAGRAGGRTRAHRGRWMVLRGHARGSRSRQRALAVFVALVAAGSTGELAVRWTSPASRSSRWAVAVRDRRWYVWPGARRSSWRTSC